MVATEHVEGVKTSLDRLQTLLKLIRNEQDYYRARVHRHVQSKLHVGGFLLLRALTNGRSIIAFCVFVALYSSESRIIFYTVFELAVLGAMYGAQSFLLHKWFSDRGYLSKRQWA